MSRIHQIPCQMFKLFCKSDISKHNAHYTTFCLTWGKMIGVIYIWLSPLAWLMRLDIYGTYSFSTFDKWKTQNIWDERCLLYKIVQLRIFIWKYMQSGSIKKVVLKLSAKLLFIKDYNIFSENYLTQ